MSDINETALNAVYVKGYKRGWDDCHKDLKGGKRWWIFWPLTFFTGAFIGFMLGFVAFMALNHYGAFHP